MYEWIMTEAIQIRSLNEHGTRAVIMDHDGTKAVVVGYLLHGHEGADIIYLNGDKYIVGEDSAECLVTWMHQAAVEFGDGEMTLKPHDWDIDEFGLLNFEMAR
jgi:hypothetical protein